MASLSAGGFDVGITSYCRAQRGQVAYRLPPRRYDLISGQRLEVARSGLIRLPSVIVVARAIVRVSLCPPDTRRARWPIICNTVRFLAVGRIVSFYQAER
jgi:hypothetical protein